MPAQDDPLPRWQRNRSARLAQLAWLRTDTSRGVPARFVADELLVRTEHHRAARGIVTGLGHQARDIAEDEVVPGFRRLRVPGLDVPGAVRRIHAQVSGDPVAGPNHVFLSSPYEHGGPFGPPVPTAALQVPDDGASDTGVRVVVLDTGVWQRSPLPAHWYEATPGDYEEGIDVDDDGIIDTDVGHANFITGVVRRHTDNVRVRIVKVLDTFGVCTEADLASSLLSLSTVDVVNLSLGGYTVDDQPPVVLRSALDTLLTGTDRAVVAAAGNDGVAGRPFWPAAFAAADTPWADRVLAVAAHDGQTICPWSNTGPWVSLAAPGADVTSTYVNHKAFESGWAQWSGTSFAAPYVVAAIAQRALKTGSIAAALDEVRRAAATQVYDRWPALP
jgi:thermitase